MSRLVRVYRGTRKRETYLFVDFAENLERVPEPLLAQFGEPVQVLTLKLTPDRRLARADAAVVLERIETLGYYLQMPPSPEETQA